MSNVVLVETKGSVCYVTINRPDKLNALSWEVWQELGKAFDAFEKSDARVCVLSGSGKKAFVAGADIDAYRTMSAKDFSEFIVEQYGRYLVTCNLLAPAKIFGKMKISLNIF